MKQSEQSEQQNRGLTFGKCVILLLIAFLGVIMLYFLREEYEAAKLRGALEEVNEVLQEQQTQRIQDHINRCRALYKRDGYVPYECNH